MMKRQELWKLERPENPKNMIKDESMQKRGRNLDKLQSFPIPFLF